MHFLSTTYLSKTEGIIIRARARWHEHGEKSTKYFLNLEKRNHVKKHIRKLGIGPIWGITSLTPLSSLAERFHKKNRVFFLQLNPIFGYYDAKWALHLLEKRFSTFFFFTKN